MARADAVARVLKTLSFSADSRQGPDEDATGHKGFYYHFLDMRSVQRAMQCELSTIDTAILLAGMLVAAQYFDRCTANEKKVRALPHTSARGSTGSGSSTRT